MLVGNKNINRTDSGGKHNNKSNKSSGRDNEQSGEPANMSTPTQLRMNGWVNNKKYMVSIRKRKYTTVDPS